MTANVRLDPALAILMVCGGSALFALAAIHKLRDMRHFSAAFANYRVPPALLRLKLSWAMPALELGVAVGLWVPAGTVPAVLLAIALLLVYSAAITLNLLAGRSGIACGCGGPDPEQPIAWWMVWRNLLLSALFLAVLAPRSVRALEPTDFATIGFGLAAMALLYATAGRLLLQNRTRS
ncbi:MAG TPA: MauE/DoxX family redox-associated membrane protein [Steroidobacteraceae bacterium]